MYYHEDNDIVAVRARICDDGTVYALEEEPIFAESMAKLTEMTMLTTVKYEYTQQSIWLRKIKLVCNFCAYFCFVR